MGITQAAHAMGITRATLSELVNDRRSISSKIAM
ncbi:MAG: helix-turn-helix domain-containing protein [Terracidiphilus sp.]